MEWKDIKGYEGMYQISKDGNFRKCGNEGWEVKPLKNSSSRRWQVCLTKNGKSRKKYLHLLIARHSLDNPSDSNRCGFEDGDINNCKVNNLYWM